MKIRRLIRTLPVLALVGCLVGVTQSTHASKAQAGGMSFVYCAVGTASAGGVQREPAPGAGKRCFATPVEAIRVLHPNVAEVTDFPAGVRVQAPPDVKYDLADCSMTYPMGEAPAKGQRWFIHCNGGWYGVVTG